MKLQDAIDKAEKIRERQAKSTKVMSIRRSQAFEYVADQSQWTAPVYKTSAKIPIKPEMVKANRGICIEPDSPGAECYKILRAEIQHQAKDNNRNTVLITSPTPGEGKTLTAVNLALILARAYNQTVLLADCDLKHQNIHKLLGIQSDAGLQDYLVDEASLEKIIVWPGIEKLSLISGGKRTTNSADVLGSPRMMALVNELKQRYRDRIIVFDAPAVLSGADTLALTPLVDCIVMVVAHGQTTYKDVHKALEMLPAEKLLGFVMNRANTI